ncbi:MAG: hypothetical protein ABSC42_08510 [Tepidisphaeraceae bacterium]|jgi:hypothetical protein
MDSQQTHCDNPTALLTLMELREDSRQVWQPSELAAILKHQLRAPLRLALGDLSGQVVHHLELMAKAGGAPSTLDELFRQAQPSFELLDLTKRFAKSCNLDGNSPLPREIAILLYYVSIAAADMRCQKRLSKLSDESLSRGLAWCGAQTWLDEPVRLVVDEAMGRAGQKKTAQADGAMPAVQD